MSSSMNSIISWNVNSVRKREELLKQLLSDHKPDVVCLQEIKCQEEQFPISFFDMGYNSYISGQKSYNGVAILSKKPAEKVDIILDGYDYPEARFIKILCGNTVFYNIYVTNGQMIGSPAYYKQMAFLDSVIRKVKQDIAEGLKVFVSGDFNIAPKDIHADFALRSSFICCNQLRAKWYELLSVGLYDFFPDTYTWWDYRYKGNIGARIDCILSSQSKDINTKDDQSFNTAVLDKYRFNVESPSDHVPILLSF